MTDDMGFRIKDRHFHVGRLRDCEGDPNLVAGVDGGGRGTEGDVRCPERTREDSQPATRQSPHGLLRHVRPPVGNLGGRAGSGLPEPSNSSSRLVWSCHLPFDVYLWVQVLRLLSYFCGPAKPAHSGRWPAPPPGHSTRREWVQDALVRSSASGSTQLSVFDQALWAIEGRDGPDEFRREPSAHRGSGSVKFTPLPILILLGASWESFGNRVGHSSTPQLQF